MLHRMQIIHHQKFRNRFYMSLQGISVERTKHEVVGNAKFCLIVDESRDIAKREQQAIVL